MDTPERTMNRADRLALRTYWLTATLVVALSAGAATLSGQQDAGTTPNGLEPTPLLGWSSWSFLRKEPTADQVEAQARAMRDSGLQKLGYTYVNLDDFWYQCPGPQGPNVKKKRAPDRP